VDPRACILLGIQDSRNEFPGISESINWFNQGVYSRTHLGTFGVARKYWLFADTSKGAAASTAVYSITETAKANDLNVYTYLQYLLLYCQIRTGVIIQKNRII
jgi:hypothetical protein